MTGEILSELSFYKELFSGEASRDYQFQGRYGPVIGIHGFLGGWNKGSLRDYMKESSVAGTLLYCGHFLDGIGTYVDRLKKTIDLYEVPLIVGFSAGGMTAIKCVAENNYWDRVKKIITIATPLGGIPRAFDTLNALSKTTRDFSRDSKTLRDIQALKPPKNKIISVFAKRDIFTPNPSSLRLSWPSIIVNAQGHHNFMHNHIKWLKPLLDTELGIPF